MPLPNTPPLAEAEAASYWAMPPEALLVGLHTVAAGASLFLSFLPLLPPQILFTNLPEIIIGTDNVEAEAIERLAKWNLGFLRCSMPAFGLFSSVFDFMSFGLLLLEFQTNESLFQTSWFVELVLSASTILLVVRT